MSDLTDYRRFYAEEIAAIAGLSTQALIEAFQVVPRERFLPPGPWVVRGEGDFGGRPRQTPDADPRHTYHNYSVALDPARQLFNGAPGIVAGWIDQLELRRGGRVLHIGAGTGYYSAILAHAVGETGRVVAIEVDELLGTAARENLSSMPWAQVRIENGTAAFEEKFDGILIHAGATHPRDTWLDALETGGRLLIPLTATMPAMGPLGKGFMVKLTKAADDSCTARTLSFVNIYSGVGLRDDRMNSALGAAMTRAPFPTFTRLRRDAHEAGPGCWLHGDTTCLT